MFFRYFYRASWFCVFFLVQKEVYAALQDEIQVYDDTINQPQQWGLELHTNITPAGQSAPNTVVPGVAGNVHGLRNTFEVSYGLTSTLEAGLYVPIVTAPYYGTEFAGPRFRLKWIPQQAPNGGLFYGLNLELSDVKAQYIPYQYESEVRPILGYRTPDWLFVTNPVLDYPLKSGYRQNGPSFAPSFKVGRTVAEGFSSGFEYYTDLGQPALGLPPFINQYHVLFAVIDVDHKPWVFNFGIGHGLTPVSSSWTVKSIFEIPI